MNKRTRTAYQSLWRLRRWPNIKPTSDQYILLSESLDRFGTLYHCDVLSDYWLLMPSSEPASNLPIKYLGGQQDLESRQEICSASMPAKICLDHK